VKRKERNFKGKFTLILLVFLLCSLLISSSVTAQNSSISGTIRDNATLESVDDVLVSVRYSQNQTFVNSTHSDNSGYFQILGLSGGTYNVTFEVPGYMYKLEVLQLEENDTKIHDVFLTRYLYDTNGDGIPDSNEWNDKDGATVELSSGFPVCLQTIMIIVVVLIISFIMYSKIKQENLLKNAQRKRILEHIKDNPGKHYRAILKDLDLPMGVLTYHINRLEKAQYLTSRQDGMYRRFYIRGPKAEMRFILSDIQESILNVIKDNKGISQTNIAKKIGVSRKVVNYHVNILNQAGIIYIESNGRESSCYFMGS
jgi:DNA-binding MarR family transcriptional regulator